MAEGHQTRVQNVVEEMVQSLERDNIRKMQVGVCKHEEVCMSVGLCVCVFMWESPPCPSPVTSPSPLQGRMFQCSAQCCDQPTDSMSQVHQCIDKCHTPLARAQGLVTSELEKFQVRSPPHPSITMDVKMLLMISATIHIVVVWILQLWSQRNLQRENTKASSWIQLHWHCTHEWDYVREQSLKLTCYVSLWILLVSLLADIYYYYIL